MSILIAAVLVIALIAVLTLFMGRSKPNTLDPNNKKTNKAKILKEANKRLEKNPHDPQGLKAVGEIYFTSQLWDKACPVYTDLVNLGMTDKTGQIDLLESTIRLGICCMNLGKIPEAIQALSNAQKINPSSYETNYNLAEAFIKAEKFDKAVPLLKKSLTLNPEAIQIYAMLAHCLYKSGKYRECLSLFKRSLDDNPTDKQSLYEMADAMTQEGHGDKALKIFTHLRADPIYGSRSCLAAGVYHAKMGNLDQALQDFEIGLKHENTELEVKIEIQYNLARCYIDKNLIPKALLMLKTIRNVNDNYKDVNSLISRYQELSSNTNLQLYLTSNNNDFVALCRKFITTKYRNSNVRIQNIDVDVLYTDILAEVFSDKWEDVALFRFFRTSGSTGEIYIREFHSHMQDVKAARGFCISAGNFSEESRKYIEGRPIDLIEKNELTKVLKLIQL